MWAKKDVFYCTYSQLQLKDLRGCALCGPVFLQLFNKTVIKKTAVLNFEPGVFFDFEKVCFVYAFLMYLIITKIKL